MGESQRNVYLVTTGQYSDYNVVGIYDRREDADTVARLLDGVVDERQMNTPDRALFSIPVWCVVFYDNGNLWCETSDALDDYVEMKPRRAEVMRFDYMEPYSYQVNVKAPNQEGAIKIAAEKVAQYKANEAGIA